MHALCAVVDWNPSGAHIYSIYKYGGSAGLLGFQQHVLPTLEWVAARAGMLHGVPDNTLQACMRQSGTAFAKRGSAVVHHQPHLHQPHVHQPRRLDRFTLFITHYHPSSCARFCQ